MAEGWVGGGGGGGAGKDLRPKSCIWEDKNSSSHFWKDNHFSWVEQASDWSQKDNAPL